jgi:hypothetical protein
MARMIRKQVYITPDQEAHRKRLSRERGTTESDLIRRGVEQVVRIPTSGRDRRAWEEEVAFMKERAKLPHLGAPRSWTREDIYEERINRVLRRH